LAPCSARPHRSRQSAAGPYYLTSLVALLGAVSSVAATARKPRETRVIGSGPKAGVAFPVEVPTHVTALIQFAGGAGASTTFSFDSPDPGIAFEVTGTEATLSVPDPNRFDGPLRIRSAGDSDWQELPIEGTEAGRGIGVLDMARGLRTGAPHRASGALALHVLDVMSAISDSAERGSFVAIGTLPQKIEPLPASWDPFEATLANS
jgi:predicted dehydrogenase